ncbi:MAG TPA: glycosyltransferase family 4 protein [Vicinamibacteria bacterium]|nr:glycosyltransferase family 4 protein [Vicinamibacteria bacterium]
MKPRAIHQVLAALAYGDAIGNEALAIRGHLKSRGYESDIFAEKVHPQMAGLARPLSEYEGAAGADTLCMFHFSIGSAASSLVFHRADPLICVYHNITPPEFFFPFHPHLARLCYHGRRELKAFAARSVLGLGVSEFNRKELEAAGFKPTGVLPIVVDWSRYDEAPSPVMLERLAGFPGPTLLFVGRIVPNKKIEDLIATFAAFQRHHAPKSRLLLVGDSVGHERYLRRLLETVHDLRARNVVFTGQVTQADLIAAYRSSQAFVCLSEHEGFCVPLLEAMHFGLPVLAYDAAAVGETMNGGGILLEDKDPRFVAAALDRVLTDHAFRSAVLKSQARTLAAAKATDFGRLLEAHIATALESAVARA